MAGQGIERIEEILAVASKRFIGFLTCYTGSRYLYSQVMYNEQTEEKDRRPLKYNLYPIRFFEADPPNVHEVPIDKRIEEIFIYHAQYGVAVSDEHECFFITSWLKGIYCCDLKTGQILWNYRLKHATKFHRI